MATVRHPRSLSPRCYSRCYSLSSSLCLSLRLSTSPHLLSPSAARATGRWAARRRVQCGQREAGRRERLLLDHSLSLSSFNASNIWLSSSSHPSSRHPLATTAVLRFYIPTLDAPSLGFGSWCFSWSIATRLPSTRFDDIALLACLLGRF